MSKNGTTTRAIDKAIQDYFNSPSTRIEYVDGVETNVSIPKIASVDDCCLEASEETAIKVSERLITEHNENVIIKNGTNSVLIVQDCECNGLETEIVEEEEEELFPEPKVSKKPKK